MNAHAARGGKGGRVPNWFLPIWCCQAKRAL